MDEMQISIQEILKQIENLPPKKFEKAILKISDDIATEIEKDLISRAPKMLRQSRRDASKFESRNFSRWRPAFDLIETLWVCCEEIGRNFNQCFRPEAIANQDFVFEAITAIHAKSLLVLSEMICLMKGGFADAALTRWRTLYELNVVAILIAQEGQDLALRYIAHADVQAAKDIEPEEQSRDEEAEILLRRANYAISQFGEDLQKHYGWACVLVGKKQPTFKDLETISGKADGSNIYRQASRHVHSNHRTYDEMLGLSESDEMLLLVGPSNSGMTGPLILGAYTMMEITSIYLLSKPNYDRLIYSRVLSKIAHRLPKVANRLEKQTLGKARQQAARSKRNARS